MANSIVERFLPVDQLLEVTLTLVLVYLVVRNASSVAQVWNSLSASYIGGVKALQGR